MRARLSDKRSIEERIEDILADDAASFWIKESLRSAIERDCVDAATDVKILAKLLCDRADAILRLPY